MRAFAYVHFWNPTEQYGYVTLESPIPSLDHSAWPLAGTQLRFDSRHLPGGLSTLPVDARYEVDADDRHAIGWHHRFSRFWMVEVEYTGDSPSSLQARQVLPVTGFCDGCRDMRALVLPQQYGIRGYVASLGESGLCTSCAPGASSIKPLLLAGRPEDSKSFQKRKERGNAAECLVRDMFMNLGCSVVNFGAEHTVPEALLAAQYCHSSVAEAVRCMPDLIVYHPPHIFSLVEVKSYIPKARILAAPRQHWPEAALVVVRFQTRQVLACSLKQVLLPGPASIDVGEATEQNVPVAESVFVSASTFFGLNAQEYERVINELFDRAEVPVR